MAAASIAYARKNGRIEIERYINLSVSNRRLILVIQLFVFKHSDSQDYSVTFLNPARS